MVLQKPQNDDPLQSQHILLLVDTRTIMCTAFYALTSLSFNHLLFALKPEKKYILKMNQSNKQNISNKTQSNDLVIIFFFLLLKCCFIHNTTFRIRKFDGFFIVRIFI